MANIIYRQFLIVQGSQPKHFSKEPGSTPPSPLLLPPPPTSISDLRPEQTLFINQSTIPRAQPISTNMAADTTSSLSLHLSPPHVQVYQPLHHLPPSLPATCVCTQDNVAAMTSWLVLTEQGRLEYVNPENSCRST